MSRDKIVVGLDIGSSVVRTAVASYRDDDSKPQIIGTGVAPSNGIRRGVVVDIDDATKSIIASIEEAERTSGVPIEHAYVSIGGSHITSKNSKGVIAVSRADGEISNEDVGRVLTAAEAISIPQNREIIHILPREYNVDGEAGIKDPVGMTGVRLEVDTFIVEGSVPVIRNIQKCVSEAGVRIDDLILDVLASARASLSKRQKELGVLALDIGAGTTGMVVYEEGNILSSKVLPVGASHITNDVAIGLRTAIDVAEKVKIEYGSCLAGEISKKEMINLAKLGEEEGTVPRSNIVLIIEARVAEILNMVNKELKSVDRAGLLPAGVVLLGGGVKIPGIVDLAKQELKLPVQLGFPIDIEGVVERVDDPSFATAVGLVLWGMDNDLRLGRRGISFPTIPGISSSVDKMKRWFRSLLP